MVSLLLILASPSLPATAAGEFAQAPSVDRADSMPGVAIEARLAERYSLAVGDTVSLTAAADQPTRRFLVEAVYQPRADPATALRGEYLIRFHLPDLALLLGYPDRVDRIAVAGRPGVTPDSTAARLNQLAFGYRAYPSTEIAAESSQTFAVVSRFHRAIGIIAIVASSIFLLCIMLLKVEERRLDAAVMRMIGISAATVYRAFVLEAAFVAVIGSAAGVGLAAAAGGAAVTQEFAPGFKVSAVAHLLVRSTDVLEPGVVLLEVLDHVVQLERVGRVERERLGVE